MQRLHGPSPLSPGAAVLGRTVKPDGVSGGVRFGDPVTPGSLPRHAGAGLGSVAGSPPDSAASAGAATAATTVSPGGSFQLVSPPLLQSCAGLPVGTPAEGHTGRQFMVRFVAVVVRWLCAPSVLTMDRFHRLLAPLPIF